MEMKKNIVNNRTTIDLINLSSVELLEIITALKERSDKFVNETKSKDNKARKLHNRIIFLFQNLKKT